MSLISVLEQQKAKIVKKWFDDIASTYPIDTSRFMLSNSDPFANPVGNTFNKSLASIFDELIGSLDRETVLSFLDPVIKIRAVQAFTPAQAIGFVFLLKQVVRGFLKKEIAADPKILEELLEFEIKIDEIGLLAFNSYMNCREKIFDLKANEMRNTTYKAFKRAGLVQDEEGTATTS